MKTKILYLFTFFITAYASKAQVYFIFPSHVKEHHIKTVKQTTYSGKRLVSITNLIFDEEGRLLQSDGYYFVKADTIRTQSGNYFLQQADTNRTLEYIVYSDSCKVSRKYNYVNNILQDSTVYKFVTRLGPFMELEVVKKEYYLTWFYDIQTGKRTFTEHYTQERGTTIPELNGSIRSEKYFENDTLVYFDYSFTGNQYTVDKKKIKITKSTYQYMPTKRVTIDSTIEMASKNKTTRENWSYNTTQENWSDKWGKYFLQSWQETDSLNRTFKKIEFSSAGDTVSIQTNFYDVNWKLIGFELKDPYQKIETIYSYSTFRETNALDELLTFKVTLILNKEENTYRKFVMTLDKFGIQTNYSEYKCQDTSVCNEKTKKILYGYTFYPRN